jgi:hypothetical protein
VPIAPLSAPRCQDQYLHEVFEQKKEEMLEEYLNQDDGEVNQIQAYGLQPSMIQRKRSTARPSTPRSSRDFVTGPPTPDQGLHTSSSPDSSRRQAAKRARSASGESQGDEPKAQRARTCCQQPAARQARTPRTRKPRNQRVTTPAMQATAMESDGVSMGAQRSTTSTAAPDEAQQMQMQSSYLAWLEAALWTAPPMGYQPAHDAPAMGNNQWPHAAAAYNDPLVQQYMQQQQQQLLSDFQASLQAGQGVQPHVQQVAQTEASPEDCGLIVEVCWE